MFQHLNNQSSNFKGAAGTQVQNIGATADRQKKYNTIDTSIQNMQQMQVNQNNNLISQGQSPTPAHQMATGITGQHGGAAHGAPPGATQETAGTSNPSNEANVNGEFIDVGRKIPRILCERYELTDVLGKGAHGRIYLATDLVTHDRVAIKLMEKSSKNKSKFQREISLMKDMMKLAKKKPLKENCIQYQDPETVQLNAKLQQQQQQKQSSTGSISTISKNRRIGFPRLFSYCSDQNYYYLVMQLLGVNLKELKESFKECKFQIQTVIIIALQLMNRLQSIHSQGYIHRDLKPANVVIGNDSNEAHFIYLIDFGLAKKESSTNPPIDTSKNKHGEKTGGADNDPETLVDPKTGKKKTAMQTLKEFMIEEQDNFRVVGTAMYAALAAHLPNKKYLKKDDIESLFFLLSYFGVGQLPWRYKTNQEGLEKMMQYKYEIKPKELFPPDVFPPQFGKLFEYIRAIPDDEEADFSYIEAELIQASQMTKVDPSLLIALDWMNCRPIVQPQYLTHQQQSNIHKQAQSPQPQPKGRQINNSQLSKNSQGVPGLKTPMHSDKINKKQPFTLTPDIHTKTYAERSGLQGLGSVAFAGIVGSGPGSTSLNATQNHGYKYDPSHIQNSVKNYHGQQLHGVNLNIGTSGIHSNNTSVLAAMQNNSQMDHDSIRMNNTDQDQLGEDFIMMNIPREGNADQLNKSTKLTLSSKKQYENHLQNIPIHQHLNNQGQQTQNGNQQMSGYQGQNQNLINMQSINNMNRTKMNSTMMVKFHSSTEKTIGVPGARTNLNKSTLLPSNMVNTSNRQDGNLMHQNVHMSNVGQGNPRTSNSTNAKNNNTAGASGLKLNPNIVGNNGVNGQMDGNTLFDKNLQQNSLDHLNRSLNMHQIQAAFSNNNSFQQSPPNLRNNKGILGNQSQIGGNSGTTHHQTTLNSATNNKFNNLFDKNKASTLNIKVSQNKQGPGTQNTSMYSSGLHMQTIPANPNQQGRDNHFQLPQAPGAQGPSTQQSAKQAWNHTQSLNHTLSHGKNKDRYMQLQQQQQNNRAGNPADVNSAQQQQKQFFIGSTNNMHMQNLGGVHNNPNMQMNSVDIANQKGLMHHQSPTLSPTGNLTGAQGQNASYNIYGTPGPVTGGNNGQNSRMQGIPVGGFQMQSQKGNYNNNYKNIKVLNNQQSYGKPQTQKNQNTSVAQNNGNQSQFGSRLSHNTNMSGNTSTNMQKRSAGNQGNKQSTQQVPITLNQSTGSANNATMNSNAHHNLSQLAMSPMKSTGGVITLPSGGQGSAGQSAMQTQNQSIQQVARQSKNSSALGMIGGSIVTNNQGSANGNPNGAQSQHLERSGGGGSQAMDGQNVQNNPFNRQANSQLNKAGMMYNTMYGSGSGGQQILQSTGQMNSMGNQGGAGSQRPMPNRGSVNSNNPIHIKIEDQTGVIGGLGQMVASKTGAYTMSAVSPNPHHSANKKQFQQTGQKFNTMMKVQGIVPNTGVNKSGPNSSISVNKKQSQGMMSNQSTINRVKSKSGLNQQPSNHSNQMQTNGNQQQQFQQSQTNMSNLNHKKSSNQLNMQKSQTLQRH